MKILCIFVLSQAFFSLFERSAVSLLICPEQSEAGSGQSRVHRTPGLPC